MLESQDYICPSETIPLSFGTGRGRYAKTTWEENGLLNLKSESKAILMF